MKVFQNKTRKAVIVIKKSAIQRSAEYKKDFLDVYEIYQKERKENLGELKNETAEITKLIEEKAEEAILQILKQKLNIE